MFRARPVVRSWRPKPPAAPCPSSPSAESAPPRSQRASSVATAGSAAGPTRRRRLETFSSCDELQEYARDHAGRNARLPYATSGGAIVCEDARWPPRPCARAAPRRHHRRSRPERDRHQHAGGRDRRAGHREALRHDALPRQGETLSAYDVAGEEAVLLGELELDGSAPAGNGQTRQLLIADDKALVIATGYDETSDPPRPSPRSTSRIRPPWLPLRVLELEGTHVSARLQGATARLVIESQPEYEADRSARTTARRRAQPARPARSRTTTSPMAAASLADGPRDRRDRNRADRQLQRHRLPRGVLRARPPVRADDRPRSGLLAHRRRRGRDRRDHGLRVGDRPLRRDQTIAPPDDGVVNSIGRLLGPIRPPFRSSRRARPPSIASTRRDAGSTEYAASGEVRGTPDRPVRDVRARGRPARRLDHARDLRRRRHEGLGELRDRPRGVGRHARGGRPRRRTRPRRGHLRRALHRRHGLRRHLRADRSALHGRSLDPRGSRGDGRAQDPRLLGLPPPRRRRAPPGHRPGRARSAARSRARRPRSSTSPTRSGPSASTSSSSPTGDTARRPRSGTTTPSSTPPSTRWPSSPSQATGSGSAATAIRVDPETGLDRDRDASPTRARSSGRSSRTRTS